MQRPLVNELLDLSGKVALVTGGAGGLGQAICTRFAEAGAGVVVNYHSSQKEADQVVEKIHAQGGDAVAVQANVTVEEQVNKLISETVGKFGRLDVLVNNAATFPLNSILEMKADDWDAVVESNLRSTFLCTQLAAKQMIAQGEGGAVINIASIEAENPAPNHSHYISAKAGVVMFTKAAANELGVFGLRVNSISPGLIWREGLADDYPEGIARYERSSALGRVGLPEEIADTCLFLASRAASWVSGANLVVDGGVMTNQVY